MNYTSSFFLLLVCFVSNYSMENSQPLAKPFNQEHYQSYIALINSQGQLHDGQSAKVFPLPADGFDPEDEMFYANMLLVENIKELHATRAVPDQLSLLLQRFAILSATADSYHANRFKGMVAAIVAQAGQLTSTQQLVEMQTQLRTQKLRTESWHEAAQAWKALHEDALRNLAQAREEKEKIHADLQVQLDAAREQLTQIGFALYMSDGQKNGLHAENDLLRTQLAKAQKELAKSKKEIHRKSSENGRLKVALNYSKK